MELSSLLFPFAKKTTKRKKPTNVQMSLKKIVNAIKRIVKFFYYYGKKSKIYIGIYDSMYYCPFALLSSLKGRKGHSSDNHLSSFQKAFSIFQKAFSASRKAFSTSRKAFSTSRKLSSTFGNLYVRCLVCGRSPMGC